MVTGVLVGKDQDTGGGETTWGHREKAQGHQSCQHPALGLGLQDREKMLFRCSSPSPQVCHSDGWMETTARHLWAK